MENSSLQRFLYIIWPPVVRRFINYILTIIEKVIKGSISTMLRQIR